LINNNLQYLDSTLIDMSNVSCNRRPADSRLNSALIYAAREVFGLLQHSHPFPTNRDDSSSEMIAIRAIEPEYRHVMTIEPLTARELEVLQLIVDGYNNGAIGRNLYISVGTVKTHVRNVLRKLCVEDRTQAAIRALRSGLVH
jgi:DNA-binding NarL/FixJ family response regulator